MTAVLDASALVALLAGEPGGRAAADAAMAGAVASVNLAEARDRLIRATGRPADVAVALDRAIDAGLRVVPCDRRLAEQAADLRATHDDRRGPAVSLADYFAIAVAIELGAALVSSDLDQLSVAAGLGVELRPIANSAGVVPRV